MAHMVLVTRPEPQASEWARALTEAGYPALALPLMATQPPADASAVQALWRRLQGSSPLPPPRALMFVSPAAVHWFAHQRPAGPAAATWPEATWLCAPGLGTAQALQTALAGLHPAGPLLPVLHPPADAEQFDSEHLWPVLSGLDWAGHEVVILGGGDAQQARGRTWLTERWQAAGARVHTVLTYQRGPSVWTPEQARWAHQAWAQPADHLWLASSSDALGLLHTHHLPALLGQPAPVQASAQHRLLVTHPRIAERAAAWGWRHIAHTAPTLAQVSASLG